MIRDVGQLMEDEDLVAKEKGIDQDCHEGGLVNRIHLDSSTHHDSQEVNHEVVHVKFLLDNH